MAELVEGKRHTDLFVGIFDARHTIPGVLDYAKGQIETA